MGCEKIQIVQYYDDLTRKVRLPEELEEFAFVFDGQALVLHVDDENAAAFRAAMAPFVEAAQPTTKAKVLATLPKGRARKRDHLKVVPDVEVAATEPPNAPETHQGEESETVSAPEVPQVPEATPEPSDSRPSSEAQPRPKLAMVPDRRPRIPAVWAQSAPSTTDQKADQMLKARAWAGDVGRDLPGGMVTAQVLSDWSAWYTEQRWMDYL